MKKAISKNVCRAVTANFESRSEGRETGRTASIRSVPALASPAICEPAVIATKTGSSKLKANIKE